MRRFKWDKQVKCKRYHGTLAASACLIRYRTKNVVGCQDCLEGLKIEKKFGKKLDEDIKHNPKFIQNIKNKLRKLVFKP